jgi:hypothetical protein
MSYTRTVRFSIPTGEWNDYNIDHVTVRIRQPTLPDKLDTCIFRDGHWIVSPTVDIRHHLYLDVQVLDRAGNEARSTFFFHFESEQMQAVAPAAGESLEPRDATKLNEQPLRKRLTILLGDYP